MIGQSVSFPRGCVQRTQTRNVQQPLLQCTQNRQAENISSDKVCSCSVPVAVCLQPSPTIVFVCGCQSNWTMICKLSFGMHFIFTYTFTI